MQGKYLCKHHRVCIAGLQRRSLSLSLSLASGPLSLSPCWTLQLTKPLHTCCLAFNCFEYTFISNAFEFSLAALNMPVNVKCIQDKNFLYLYFWFIIDWKVALYCHITYIYIYIYNICIYIVIKLSLREVSLHLQINNT